MSNAHQKGLGIIEIIILIGVITTIGFVGWSVWHTRTNISSPPPVTQNENVLSNKNVFRIPELGVEFTAKDGITPLHFTQNGNYNNVNYKSIHFSTQQLVEYPLTTPCPARAMWTKL